MRFEEILVVLTLFTGLVSLIFIKYKKDNKIVEYCRSFFPVLLLVLVLRSFLYEPFRIPSGSMKPTLLVGDFILVNKFDYGIRLPVVGTKLLNLSEPQVGDIVVFRGNDGKDMIKRIIGLPGDSVRYEDKELYINDKQIHTKFLRDTQDQGIFTVEKQEQLERLSHEIYLYPEVNRYYPYMEVEVPKDSYFVMGDNRDNSQDSRVFGFVRDKDLIGRAVATWMSWGSGVRWSRIGKSIYNYDNG